MSDRFIALALEAAFAAGEVHRGRYGTGFETRGKTAATDIVTSCDLEAEEAIVETISRRFPDHTILCEERGTTGPASEYVWAIDPLDGTSNFQQGLPLFCVSIALLHHGRPVLGVVYNALKDELYRACAGEGAFCNDRPIRVSSVDTLQRGLLATGFQQSREAEVTANLANMQRFYTEGVLGLRRLGSSALDLCYVAHGRLSGYWELFLHTWDFAAGSIIVEEAGGKVSDLRGGPLPMENSSIVASNVLLHDTMLSVLHGDDR